MDPFHLKRFFKNSYGQYKKVSGYKIQEKMLMVETKSFKPSGFSGTIYEDVLEALFAWRDACEEAKRTELEDPFCRTREITETDFKKEIEFKKREQQVQEAKNIMDKIFPD